MKKETHPNPIKDIKILIKNPRKFFATKNQFPLHFLTISIFTILLIQLIIQLPTIIKLKTNLPLLQFIFFIITLIALLIATTIILTVVIYAYFTLVHIIIRLFSGHGKLKDTYVLIYALAPILLASIIPAFSVLTYLLIACVLIGAADTTYLLYVGLRRKHKMKKINALCVILVLAIIEMIVLKYILGSYF